MWSPLVILGGGVQDSQGAKSGLLESLVLHGMETLPRACIMPGPSPPTAVQTLGKYLSCCVKEDDGGTLCPLRAQGILVVRIFQAQLVDSTVEPG